MCTVQALKKGLRDITAIKRAALLLWLTNLILALAVALPVFGWLGRMNHTVAAEAMLRGFSLPLLFDLARYDFSTVMRLLGTLVFWLFLCASLISTFMSGGVLTVLVNPGREPFLEHFFAGAARYFSRFLRLLLGAGLCAGVVLLSLSVVLGILVARLSQNTSEFTLLLLGLGQGMVIFLIGAVFLLALHYARIETVVEGRTGMARTYLRSLVFVFRNLLRVFALIIFFAALTGGVYLLYVMVRTVLPTTTWSLILLLMMIQQMTVLTRCAFQVGLYGAELELFLLRSPGVPEPAFEAPAERQVPLFTNDREQDRPAQTGTD